MRCSPIKVLQILLIGSICAGIYVRLRDAGEASGPFNNRHTDPSAAAAPDMAAAEAILEAKHAQHLKRLLPADAEVVAARAKRAKADKQREADKQQAAKLKNVTRLAKFYADVDLPAGWLAQDWTGLSKAAAAGKDEGALERASIKKYAFNAMKSAVLPLRRPLKDMRSTVCQHQLYPPISMLPTVSVVICFAEEMWSSLFRTVWSVLDRTPKALLVEIILVNDASTADWLQADLTQYLVGMPPVVKMVMAPNRSGLIRARTIGAQQAHGDVIVFLDSHCEAADGWYEPIAARIKESRTTIICPTIDAISDSSMVYNAGGGMAVGGFHWTMDFTWIYRPLEPGKSQADPLTSPTMAGGLFAVDRLYWGELGGYDLQMGGWGGENLELSFRVWTCGGSQEIHPCSHVGHIFRAQHPYAVPGGFGEVYLRNSARLAATWLDEYADVFFRIRPGAVKSGYGDVSERLKLRKTLDCKPFKWYMDKFFPEKFVPTSEVIKMEGQLMNGDGKCVDKYGHQHIGESIGMYGCHGEDTASLNQAFIFTHTGQIRTIWDLCWDTTGWKRARAREAIDPDMVEKVLLSSCLPVFSTWRYNEATHQMVHTKTSKCLSSSGDDVVVAACDPADNLQKWTFSGKLNA